MTATSSDAAEIDASPHELEDLLDIETVEACLGREDDIKNYLKLLEQRSIDLHQLSTKTQNTLEAESFVKVSQATADLHEVVTLYKDYLVFCKPIEDDDENSNWGGAWSNPYVDSAGNYED
ncbi:MAG: hypothetical protein Q9198_001955 [Flavoplaca austrocitrina]